MSLKKIKVVIVDDSKTTRELLKYIISMDSELELVGMAEDGRKALEVVKKEKPDVVTMDVNLPYLNGFQVTRKIMEENPIPIVIVSSIRDEKNREEFSRLMVEAGALHFIDTPPGPTEPNFNVTSKKIIQIIKVMSGVKVIKRRPFSQNIKSGIIRKLNIKPNIKHCEYDIALIGASTGGPPVIHSILAGLPCKIPFPIVIAQHIPSGFDRYFAQDISRRFNLKAKVAENNEILCSNTIYILPGKGITTIKANKTFNISSPSENFHECLPSISQLFKSAIEVYGKRSIAVLLTGMGKDGAYETLLMKEAGAMTIIQNRQTSVVYGMPGEVERLNGARFILSPDEILKKLVKIIY